MSYEAKKDPWFYAKAVCVCAYGFFYAISF